jgi:hypothetical protein
MVEQILYKHKALILNSQYCQGKKKKEEEKEERKNKLKEGNLCFIFWSAFKNLLLM